MTDGEFDFGIDYAVIERRIILSLGIDPNLVKGGMDFYSELADLYFSEDSKLTKEQKRTAIKNVAFGFWYDSEPGSLRRIIKQSPTGRLEENK